MSTPTAPADPVVLAAVVRAAQQLNVELKRLPGVTVLVGAEMAAVQVRNACGAPARRMEMVDQFAELLQAEPRLVEEPVGGYWQADAQVDGAHVQVHALVFPSEGGAR
jgi:predicted TIM-barrel enzyme